MKYHGSYFRDITLLAIKEVIFFSYFMLCLFASYKTIDTLLTKFYFLQEILQKKSRF